MNLKELFKKDIKLPLNKSVQLEDLLYKASIFLSLIIAFFVAKCYLNFPLNDDWAYSKTVYNLVVNHRFELLDWYSMTFVSQLLWGALFCFVFGFSHVVLRISTLVLVLIGAFLLYRILKKITNNKFIAFLISYAIIFSPIFLSLSYSFMTDIPFLLVCFFGYHYYSRYLQTNKIKHLGWAALLIVAATLIRQMGIFLPIAVFGAFLLFKPFEKKRLVFAALLCFVSVFTLTAFKHILMHYNMLPEMYGNVDLLFKNSSIQTAITRLGIILTFIGVLWLPFTFIFHPFNKPKSKFIPLIVLILLFTTVFSWTSIHSTSNYISGKCVGVFTLTDSYVVELPNTFRVTELSWTIFRLFGILGAAAFLFKVCDFVWLMYQKRKSKTIDAFDLMRISSFFIICLFFLYLTLTPYQFDRYYVPITFFSVLVFIDKDIIFKNKWFKRITICFIAFFALVSVIGLHDYLAWNEARWKAIDYLMKVKKVPATEIDGGFEFNGWHFYDYNYKPKDFKSWWWVQDDKYMIAFGECPGYKKTGIYSFKRWVDYSWREVCILEKLNPIPAKNLTISTFLLDSANTFNTKFALANEKNLLVKAGNQLDTTKAYTNNTSVLVDSLCPYAFTGTIRDISIGDRLTFEVWANKRICKNELFLILSSNSDLFLSVGIDSVTSDKAWVKYRFQHLVIRPVCQSSYNFHFYHSGSDSVYLDDFKVEHQKFNFIVY